MGGMVAQELALLLIPQHRLLSLSLSITCRGMKPLYGLLSPIFVPKVTPQYECRVRELFGIAKHAEACGPGIRQEAQSVC